MPASAKTVETEGVLMADNERYRVHDYPLGDLTVSVTELKGGQETRGHSHPSRAEVYFFLDGGDAEMAVGGERFRVRQKVVLIPQGEFHKVINRSKSSSLRFVSVFSGNRREAKPKYAPG